MGRRRVVKARQEEWSVKANVPFRYVFSHSRSTAGVDVATLDLKATNIGTRVADIAVTYEYFRIRNLHVYAYTSCAAVQSGTSA